MNESWGKNYFKSLDNVGANMNRPSLATDKFGLLEEYV